MKILIFLIIVLQISCSLTCFTSASRKKLRSTWEIQCKHGVKNGNGRQAALARAIPCLLFSVTKEWSREKGEIQQDAVSELKDIVVFLNDEEIKSMVQFEEVHATISVEFDNGTYFVKVLEADNIVGPNAFRIKRHAVGTPFDVSIQICEQSCVPSYAYGGKSLDDNGQNHVQLAGLPYGKRRHYTAKPRVPASKPVTSTVRQNSTKATTTTTTSTTSTSTTLLLPQPPLLLQPRLPQQQSVPQPSLPQQQ
ncbi:unnamed protein product [Orchesella dallaii]|uniref:Uncharacterized protein n=1 Tax=Orchesella dallaii TaxID=48710 RepID=A0ABP1R1W2_9HEXA